MPTHSTSDTSQGVEAELEKILYGFGNHVWQCAQRHSGWSQEDAQAALLQLIARENKAARKHGQDSLTVSSPRWTEPPLAATDGVRAMRTYDE